MMRRFEHGWISVVLGAVTLIGIGYMLLPVFMVFPLSLESSHILRFPPNDVSLHWYGEFIVSAPWLRSAALSFQVGIGAALVATVLGTLAALGLRYAPQRFRVSCVLILLSPLFMPAIIFAIAIYGLYATLQLVDTPLGLIAAHAVITMPIVLLTVSTALANVPREFEDAAMSLGATPIAMFFQITLPLIAKGVGAGAIFAFLTSFDEVVLAMFLGGTDTVTLPKRMFDDIFFELTPMLATVSSLLVIVNVVIGIIGAAFAGGGRNSNRYRREPRELDGAGV